MNKLWQRMNVAILPLTSFAELKCVASNHMIHTLTGEEKKREEKKWKNHILFVHKLCL